MELALALGGTVQELKHRVTYSEAVKWMAYRQKHGGIGEARTAYLLGCIATMINNSNGGKAKLNDFLPGLPVPPPREISDAEEFMQYMAR